MPYWATPTSSKPSSCAPFEKRHFVGSHVPSTSRTGQVRAVVGQVLVIGSKLLGLHLQLAFERPVGIVVDSLGFFVHARVREDAVLLPDSPVRLAIVALEVSGILVVDEAEEVVEGVLAVDLLAVEDAARHFHDGPQIPLASPGGSTAFSNTELRRSAFPNWPSRSTHSATGNTTSAYLVDIVGYTSFTTMNVSKMPWLSSPLPRKRVRLGMDWAQLLCAVHRKSRLPLDISRNIFTVCMPGF